LEKVFAFDKERINMRFGEQLLRVTLENIADTENLIAIHKKSGELKVMSVRIDEMMRDYELN
jgi:hypothetical protein